MNTVAGVIPKRPSIRRRADFEQYPQFYYLLEFCMGKIIEERIFFFLYLGDYRFLLNFNAGSHRPLHERLENIEAEIRNLDEGSDDHAKKLKEKYATDYRTFEISGGIQDTLEGIFIKFTARTQMQLMEKLKQFRTYKKVAKPAVPAMRRLARNSLNASLLEAIPEANEAANLGEPGSSPRMHADWDQIMRNRLKSFLAIFDPLNRKPAIQFKRDITKPPTETTVHYNVSCFVRGCKAIVSGRVFFDAAKYRNPQATHLLVRHFTGEHAIFAKI